MTERDSFEQELARGLSPRRAPEDLQRRIARIPLDHPRAARRARSWLSWRGEIAPWTAGLAGAFASLAIGFWLGFSGAVDSTTIIDTASADEDVVALVFPSVPTTIGD
ncbi:MAG TPA: hypothetical protein VJV39_15185 [Dongiaceae bacterium]|nr:hypothetical protein [Dongiaceae bacterium]